MQSNQTIFQPQTIAVNVTGSVVASRFTPAMRQWDVVYTHTLPTRPIVLMT